MDSERLFALGREDLVFLVRNFAHLAASLLLGSVAVAAEPSDAASRPVAWTEELPASATRVPRVLLDAGTSANEEASSTAVLTDGRLLAQALRGSRAELLVLEPSGELALWRVERRERAGRLELGPVERVTLDRVPLAADGGSLAHRLESTAEGLSARIDDVSADGFGRRFASWRKEGGELAWVELGRESPGLPPRRSAGVTAHGRMDFLRELVQDEARLTH